MSTDRQLGLEELAGKYPGIPRFTILKLDLQRRGIDFSDDALEAARSRAGVFGPRGGRGVVFGSDSSSKLYPGSPILRDGTSAIIVPGLKEYSSPYLVEHEDGTFFISDGGVRLEEVDFTPRPDYYGKLTSRGVPMESIANARPQRLDITSYRHCHFWDTREQCKYCAFYTDLNAHKQVAKGRSGRLVDPEDVYEVVREALKEPGRFSQINVMGGSDFSGDPPYENELVRHIVMLQAIGRNFAAARFPSQLVAPAYQKRQLERLHAETGLTAFCSDIEVWDEALFRWICPGKTRWLGRDWWIRGILDAVEVFGRGYVSTCIVAGVEMARPHGFGTVDEALKSNLEACEFFARNGVIMLGCVWRPWRSSVFAGQVQPPLEYYVRLVKGFHEIKKAYGLTAYNDDYKHCGNHGDSDLERLN